MGTCVDVCRMFEAICFMLVVAGENMCMKVADGSERPLSTLVLKLFTSIWNDMDFSFEDSPFVTAASTNPITMSPAISIRKTHTFVLRGTKRAPTACDYKSDKWKQTNADTMLITLLRNGLKVLLS